MDLAKPTPGKTVHGIIYVPLLSCTHPKESCLVLSRRTCADCWVSGLGGLLAEKRGLKAGRVTPYNRPGCLYINLAGREEGRCPSLLPLTVDSAFIHGCHDSNRSGQGQGLELTCDMVRTPTWPCGRQSVCRVQDVLIWRLDRSARAARRVLLSDGLSDSELLLVRRIAGLGPCAPV